MKKLLFLILLLSVFGFLLFACSPSADSPDAADKEVRAAADTTTALVSDRESLIQLMDQYLDALVRHDSAGLPLAKDVKLVENAEITPIGKGLWENTTGPNMTEYKIYVADPLLGQIGFMGLLEEKGKPVQVGIRLKLVNGGITEIDHMIWRQIAEPMPEGLLKPRPGLVQRLDSSERVSREEMFRAANAYYDAIEQSDGNVAPFADECKRHEGGITAANNQEPVPED
ncbi:MAG: hypothetical protein GX846_01130, partial [Deltaproteobacteria bacterium]|nr:hypothetical protein [Deltaproteobacteria bacterium]